MYQMILSNYGFMMITHIYVDVHEQVPEGWTAIQWWGVSNLIEYLHTQSN